MLENETKNARLEARLPESVHTLLRQAAELQGALAIRFCGQRGPGGGRGGDR